MRSSTCVLRLFAVAMAAVVLVATARAESEPPLEVQARRKTELCRRAYRRRQNQSDRVRVLVQDGNGVRYDLASQVGRRRRHRRRRADDRSSSDQHELAAGRNRGIRFEKHREAAGRSRGSLLEPVVNGMLGQTFKVKISPLGKVSDIELPAKLTESFAKQKVGQNRQAGLGIGGNAFTEYAASTN